MLDNLRKGYLLFRRPKLSIGEVGDDEKMNKVIDWFLNKEKGLLDRIKYTRDILEKCVSAGFYPVENFKKGQIGIFSEGESVTLNDLIKDSLRKKIQNLTENNSDKILKEDFKELLDKINDDINSYIIDMDDFDHSATYLGNLMKDYKETENIRDVVMKNQQNQITATQIISKTYLEIISYILAWFYYIWIGVRTGEQYYYPPFKLEPAA